ncbi:helix-turn-helix domain-containing protein [Bacillus sp. IITD106]|nr:helix-turn-helix domain-containing protein [Bacillus sp. IITD106]
MDIEDQFNKEEFAILLERAKGGRSINQFANETGVSAAHISRFLRKMIASPPTPETISKFAAKAQNDVTYQDLMVAAGHLARKDDTDINSENGVERHSPMDFRERMEQLKKKFIQVILADLYEKPFKWSVEKREEKYPFSDMTLNIEHDGYNKWYLDFKPSIPDRYRPTFQPYILYGRITTFDLNETDKLTIVVNDERVFNMIRKRPPLSLRANLYVMLIDLEWGKIVKEEKLCGYWKD